MQTFSKDDKYRIMAIIIALKQLDEQGIDDYFEIIRYIDKNIDGILDYVNQNYYLAINNE